MITNNSPSHTNNFHADHIQLLLNSYQCLLHRPLLTPALSAEQVFYANFALASHNADVDPLFNYANQTALDLFEFSWAELMALPSRCSVEATNHVEREKLLAKVNATGFIEGYTGIRIAKSGKRFRINDVTVWNVCDADNNYCGQAAYFADWTLW